MTFDTTPKNLFITFEGVDGAGKSSHVDAVVSRLIEQGHTVITTREPGGTTLAESIRELVKTKDMSPETETLLLNAARQDHLERVIRPALARGDTVVCDRFSDSTFAYQGGAKKLAARRISILEDWVQQGLNPDLTLYFDVPLEVSKQRRQGRGEAADRFEQSLDDNFNALRDAYLLRLSSFPDRIRLIDGTPSIEEVRRAVFDCVDSLSLSSLTQPSAPLSGTRKSHAFKP
jgi:dTMP kinase